MIFVTWPVQPGFLQRHRVVRGLLLSFGCLVAFSLIADAMGWNLMPPRRVLAPLARPNIPLAPGVHWYLPDSLKNDPTIPRDMSYVYIPPTLGPASPDFCADMDGSYYLQPTGAQQAAWQATCPRS